MDNYFTTLSDYYLLKSLEEVFDFKEITNSFDTFLFQKNKQNKISINKNILDLEYYKPLKTIIEEEATNFLKNFYFKNFERLKVTTSWLNNAEKGEYHHKHVHPFSVVSGVIFLDSNPENLKFTLHEKLPEVPYNDSSLIRVRNLNALLEGNVPGNYLQNHMFMFLSSKEHSVSENLSNIPRRTLAFNTFYEGRVGTNNELNSIIY